MIHGKFSKIRWIPRPLSPSPIHLPFPSPSTSLPSPTLSQASQRKGSALHSLCDSRRERELEIARKRKPCIGLGSAACRLPTPHLSLEEQGTYCLQEHLLLAVCCPLQQVLESKEGRMGWETPLAIQIAVLVMKTTGCAADQNAAARDK